MGTITNENFRKLQRADNYEDAKLDMNTDMIFTQELSKLIRKKGIKINTIVERARISKSYVNKLRNVSVKTVKPSRNVIIDIALAVDASLDETNTLLKKARYQELYTRDPAESLIIWGMLKGLPGEKIREMLQEKGLDGIFRDK